MNMNTSLLCMIGADPEHYKEVFDGELYYQ